MKKNKKLWSFALAGALAVSNLSAVAIPMTAFAANTGSGNLDPGDKVKFAVGETKGTLQTGYTGELTLLDEGGTGVTGTSVALDGTLPSADVVLGNATTYKRGYSIVWTDGVTDFLTTSNQYNEIISAGSTATLTAVYMGDELTVTPNNGGVTAAQMPTIPSKRYGTNFATTIADPTATGYVFQGWDIPDYGDDIDIAPGATAAVQSSVIDKKYESTSMTTSDKAITLNAVWKTASYTIHFDSNGKESGAFNQADITWKGGDADPDLPAVPSITKTGYTLDDAVWCTTADGTGKKYSAIKSGTTANKVSDVVKDLKDTTSVTLYAVWTEQSWKVTLDDGNDATGVDATLTAGTPWSVNTTLGVATTSVLKSVGSVTLPSTVKTVNPTKNQISVVKSGYSFDGWTTTKNSETAEYTGGETVEITKDTTFYPVLTSTATPASTKKEIIFDKGDHGKGEMAKVEVESGTTYTLPASAFTPDTGYKFDKWSVKVGSSGTPVNYNPGQEVDITDATTVTATYAVNNTIEFYQGTTKKASADVIYNGTTTLAAAYTSGNGAAISDLIGWSITSGAKNYDYLTTATVDNVFTGENQTVKLYAVVDAAPLTIKYDDGETVATNNGEQKVAKNSTFKIGGGTLPTKAGSVLAGFTLKKFSSVAQADKAGAEIYKVGDSYEAKEADITFFALWKASTATVTLNANGGVGDSITLEATDGTVDLPLNTFTKAGSTFAGWRISSNNDGIDYADGETGVEVSSSMTLNAVWQPGTYIFTYDASADDVTITEPNDDVVVSDSGTAGVTFTSGKPSASAYKTGTCLGTFAGWALTKGAEEAVFTNTNSTWAKIIEAANPEDGDTITLYAVYTYTGGAKALKDAQAAAEAELASTEEALADAIEAQEAAEESLAEAEKAQAAAEDEAAAAEAAQKTAEAAQKTAEAAQKVAEASQAKAEAAQKAAEAAKGTSDEKATAAEAAKAKAEAAQKTAEAAQAKAEAAQKAAEAKAAETQNSADAANALKANAGKTSKVDGSSYKTDADAGQSVTVTKAKNAKTVTIDETVEIAGNTYKVRSIKAKAFKGKKIKTIKIAGKNLTTVDVNAFKGTKATKITITGASKAVKKQLKAAAKKAGFKYSVKGKKVTLTKK